MLALQDFGLRPIAMSGNGRQQDDGPRNRKAAENQAEANNNRHSHCRTPTRSTP